MLLSTHQAIKSFFFQNILLFTASRMVSRQKLSIIMQRKSFCERAHRLNPCDWTMCKLIKCRFHRHQRGLPHFNDILPCSAVRQGCKCYDKAAFHIQQISRSAVSGCRDMSTVSKNKVMLTAFAFPASFFNYDKIMKSLYLC